MKNKKIKKLKWRWYWVIVLLVIVSRGNLYFPYFNSSAYTFWYGVMYFFLIPLTYFLLIRFGMFIYYKIKFSGKKNETK